MKKFFVLMLLALVLLAGAAGVFIHFYLLQDYVVFVESFDNGLLTVDSIRTEGTDRKFRVLCKYGEFLTVHINPSRSERGYYDLERLTARRALARQPDRGRKAVAARPVARRDQQHALSRLARRLQYEGSRRRL